MKKIIIYLLTGLLLIPSLVFADGGVLPPDNYYIYETGQKGAIVYDNNVETLVLSTSFEGDTGDFSWIIPTPNEPEVSKVSKDIFTNLAELTNTQVSNRSTSSFGAASLDAGSMEEVQIIEEKQIGYYDVTILKSSNEDVLYDWLNENGYQYPEDGKYILNDYIRLGWTFTAVKISDDAISNTDIQNKLYDGEISPLKLVFTADNLVFPLKISSINQYFEVPDMYKDIIEENDITYPEQESIAPYYPTGMSIDLYIFADSKKELTGFSTDYAGWIDSNEINKLATDEQGNPWVNTDKKYYLTKLSTYMELSEMDEDLYPKDADNNDTVGVLSWWEKALDWIMQGILLVIIVLILMFFVPIYWQFKPTSRLSHIVFWTLQIFSFMFLGALPLIYATMIVFESIGYGYMDFSMIMIGIPYIIMPLMMLVLLIAQGIWQKKNIQR